MGVRNLNLVKNILSAKIRKVPYKLNFSITEICNGRCLTCNIGRESQRRENLPDPNELTLSEIRRIFIQFPSLCWLSISGGEPFLRTALREIILSAIELCPNLGLISIPTNGLTEEKILSLVRDLLLLKQRPYIYVNISLDGPPNVNDRIRNIPGGYDTAWKTYEHLLELTKGKSGFHIGIETTISKYNSLELPRFFADLLRNKHKITATIAHASSYYRLASGDPRPNPKDAIGPINLLSSHLSFCVPENLIFKIYLSGAKKFLRKQKQMILPCAAGDRSISLRSDGMITPCLMWKKVIGNVRSFSYSLPNASKSEAAVRYREEIKAGRCPLCWTPCEATQTIIDNFPRALLNLFRE